MKIPNLETYACQNSVAMETSSYVDNDPSLLPGKCHVKLESLAAFSQIFQKL